MNLPNSSFRSVESVFSAFCFLTGPASSALDLPLTPAEASPSCVEEGSWRAGAAQAEEPGVPSPPSSVGEDRGERPFPIAAPGETNAKTWQLQNEPEATSPLPRRRGQVGNVGRLSAVGILQGGCRCLFSINELSKKYPVGFNEVFGVKRNSHI